MSSFLKDLLIYGGLTGGSFVVCIVLASISEKIANALPGKTNAGTYALSSAGAVVGFISGYFSIMRFCFPVLWITSNWPKVFSVLLVLSTLAALYLSIASAHTIYAGYRSMFSLSPISILFIAIITIALIHVPVYFAATAVQVAFELSALATTLIYYISYGILALVNVIALLMANVER